uniref:Uncharacterized protein n=1 Tax=Paracidobacterium acidisoli TaxID=2303751 RepID=A0A372IMA8_9BACT
MFNADRERASEWGRERSVQAGGRRLLASKHSAQEEWLCRENQSAANGLSLDFQGGAGFRGGSGCGAMHRRHKGEPKLAFDDMF